MGVQGWAITMSNYNGHSEKGVMRGSAAGPSTDKGPLNEYNTSTQEAGYLNEYMDEVRHLSQQTHSLRASWLSGVTSISQGRACALFTIGYPWLSMAVSNLGPQDVRAALAGYQGRLEENSDDQVRTQHVCVCSE